MAGFSKIKRKISRQVVGGGSVVIFEDLNPFEVEYQKFYDNEDMYYFSHEMFALFEEKLLHKQFKSFKYKPLINFDGSTECFKYV